MRVLDPTQTRAAHAPVDRSLNVLAGAGTGKTSVLVERFITFVERDGVALDRVLALTFTLKAAGEMRERVREQIGKRVPHLATSFPSAWIMNFHQFGYRFIKENAPALGIDPGIDVVSTAEFKRIEARLKARFEHGTIPGVPPGFGGAPPAPTKLGSVFDLLLRVVHHCRGNLVAPEELRARVRGDDVPFYAAYVDTVLALAGEYEAELRRRNLLDFSDMISIPVRALQSDPALAARYRDLFEHILVDEFQDTSRAQNEMLRAIAGDDFARVTVVGDVKQSIYRWRDARVENIIEFPAPREELGVNYRSRRAVLDLAHALVADTPELADFAIPLAPHRGEATHPVLLFHPRDTRSSYEQEARALAAWVEYLLGRKPAPEAWGLAPIEKALEPGDVCVLLRRMTSTSDTRKAIEAEFAARGIPYAIIGGANRAEARALDQWHAFMSLLLPGKRGVDLLAVLENEPFRVREASLTELLRHRPRGTIAAWDLLAEARIALVQDARDAALLRDLRALLMEIEGASARLGFREFIVYAFDKSALRMHLVDAGVSPEASDELLRELLELADLLARRGGATLAVYLEHLRAALDDRKFREDGDVRLPRDRVAIMTVHQAKGLQFPAVAVPGLEPFRPRSEGFLVSEEQGVFFGGDLWEGEDRQRKNAPNYKSEEAMKALEERCIVYVALTRAMDHLWVSSPVADGAHLKKDGRNESEFTRLLACAQARQLAVQLREAPAEEPTSSTEDTRQVSDADLDAALSQWGAARAAAEAAPTRAAGELTTMTWSDLYAASHTGVPMAMDDAPTAGLPRGIDAAAFGAFVHAALEALALGAPGVDDALQRALPRFDFGKRNDDALAAARLRIQPVLTALPFTKTTRTELPFAVRIGNTLIQGIIDRLDQTPDGYLVTDYKVGEKSDAHSFQASLYAWAIDKALGQSGTKAQVVYLRDGGVEVVGVEKQFAPKREVESGD